MKPETISVASAEDMVGWRCGGGEGWTCWREVDGWFWRDPSNGWSWLELVGECEAVIDVHVLWDAKV